MPAKETQSNLEDMELFWPKFDPTDSFKSSAMPAADSRIKKNIWHPFCWKCQPRSGEWSTSLTSWEADTLPCTPITNLWLIWEQFIPRLCLKFRKQCSNTILRSFTRKEVKCQQIFSVEMSSVNSGRNALTVCSSKIKTSNWNKTRNPGSRRSRTGWWRDQNAKCQWRSVTWKIIGTIDFSSKMTYSGSESKSEQNQHKFVWSCQITKSKKFWETVMERC